MLRPGDWEYDDTGCLYNGTWFTSRVGTWVTQRGKYKKGKPLTRCALSVLGYSYTGDCTSRPHEARDNLLKSLRLTEWPR